MKLYKGVEVAEAHAKLVVAHQDDVNRETVRQSARIAAKHLVLFLGSEGHLSADDAEDFFADLRSWFDAGAKQEAREAIHEAARELREGADRGR